MPRSELSPKDSRRRSGPLRFVVAAVVVACLCGLAGMTAVNGEAEHPPSNRIQLLAAVAPDNPVTSTPFPHSSYPVCTDPEHAADTNSASCISYWLNEINAAQASEGAPAISIPSDWPSLTPAEQVLTAVNAERMAWGLAPFAGLVGPLNSAAQVAMENNRDPMEETPTFPEHGGIWGGGTDNPLELTFLWMYDDGPGGDNLDCTSASAPGCWGHRDIILFSYYGYSGPELVAGAADGFSSTGGLSTAAVFSHSSTPDPALTWAWSDPGPAYVPVTMGSASPTATAPSGDSATGCPPISTATVGMASLPGGGGYWDVTASGVVHSFGTARTEGSMAGIQLNKAVVGMAPTPTGKGYWLVACDGGIFSFGSAQFYGSMGGHPLNKPIVGIAAVPGGGGYWEVASDGGIFSFGTAQFFGSEA